MFWFLLASTAYQTLDSCCSFVEHLLTHKMPSSPTAFFCCCGCRCRLKTSVWIQLNSTKYRLHVKLEDEWLPKSVQRLSVCSAGLSPLLCLFRVIKTITSNYFWLSGSMIWRWWGRSGQTRPSSLAPMIYPEQCGNLRDMEDRVSQKNGKRRGFWKVSRQQAVSARPPHNPTAAQGSAEQ